MVTHKLMGSVAQKAQYLFTNSAQRETDDGKPEKGVHMSFQSGEEAVNLFVPADGALKMFINMRDSLRHVISVMSEEDKMALRVIAERDNWGESRISGRKAHIAEDLGLEWDGVL